MALTLFECKKGVVMVSLSSMLMQAGYGALESVQSSLNNETGTTSLALLFAAYMISSLFFPPLVISKIGCKKTLAMGVFTHAIYNAANFCPKPFVLYPAAVILGIGLSFYSTAIIIYVIHVSQAFAQLLDKVPSQYTNMLFGILYAFINFGSFCGALVMSIIMKSFGSSEKVIILSTNDTVIITSTLPYNDVSTQFQRHSNVSTQCGFYYDMEDEGSEVKPSIPLQTLYLIVGLNVFLCTLAAILCMFLKDIDSEEVNCNYKVKSCEENLAAFVVEDSEKSELDPVAKINIPVSHKKSMFSLLRSTLKLLITDNAALLVITHTVHVGVLKAFSRSVFNAAWISCWLGIEYVGYIMATYSAVLTVVSFLSGYLLKIFSFGLLFGLVMLVELAICGTLYIWKPTEHDVVIYYVIMCVFACCYGIVKTQTPSAYDKLFSNHKEQAAALQGVMEAIGLSVMFGLSGVVYPITSMYVFLVLSFTSCVLFIFGCRIKDKEFRYWSCFNICETDAKKSNIYVASA